MGSTKIERLRCKLTPDERQVKTDELTRMMAELDDLKAKKAASAQTFAQRIKQSELDIASIAHDVRDCSEVRPVECRERPNYDNRTVELVRTDLDEVVSTRAMTESERQMALDMEEKPEKPAPKRRSKPPRGPFLLTEGDSLG